MIRRRVKRSEWEKEPYYFGWNAFVDLICSESYEDLSNAQKIAHLIFVYDAEVLNGGHLQYFVNPSGRFAVETVDALAELNMECNKSILIDAIECVLRHPLPEINTLEEYAAEALNNRFGNFDMRYYSCSKEANVFLENYLQDQFSEFIGLT